jgi:post-segregation antitoxin (ccd killing protein)
VPPNRKGVRVTLYLPDDLRERARAANLNLSALLRDAVERRLAGDATPTVQIERVGDSVEVRVAVPVEALRTHTK